MAPYTSAAFACFFFLRKMNFKSGHAQYSSNHILSSFHMFKYFPSSQTEWLFSLVTECRVGQIPGVENGQCATIAKQRMVSVGRSIAKHCSILTCDLKGAVGNQFEYQKNNDCPLFIIQNTAIYFKSWTQPWLIVKCRCQSMSMSPMSCYCRSPLCNCKELWKKAPRNVCNLSRIIRVYTVLWIPEGQEYS